MDVIEGLYPAFLELGYSPCLLYTSDYFKGEWRRRAMMEYFNPDAPEYGCYEVIPEEEAMILIKE